MKNSDRDLMTRQRLRIGKCYFLRNNGETTSFTVLEVIDDHDYLIKDLLSMESYLYSRLTRYGLGNDFDLYEIDC
jgi:hypothetical protein